MNLKMNLKYVAVLCFLLSPVLLAKQEFMEISQLPAIEGTVGLAGPYAGVSGGALLVAGGANFPNGRPWDGFAKIWHDDIYVLSDRGGQWFNTGQKLPAPAAYGISLTWGDSVICVGGSDKEKCFSDVYKMTWNGEQITIEAMSPLPKPLAFMCGAILNDVIYVAGGITYPDSDTTENALLALDLKAKTKKWINLGKWSDKGRMLAIAGVQDGMFFLFGGVDLYKNDAGSIEREYLNDAYRFKPGEGWKKIADMPVTLAGSPTPALSVGPTHLIIFGGDDSSCYGKNLKDDHPGFIDNIYMYHTITDTWIVADQLKKLPGEAMNISPSVTTNAVLWNGDYIVPSGEVRPGVRTPGSYSVSLIKHKGRFNVIDYVVIVLYLLSLVGIGYYFSKREKGTDDFFKGGQRVPWWAAGLSVFATMLSAITFMAIPAKSYSTNWVFIVANISVLLLAPFVIRFYLPFYRKLDITSAYEYLEKRFNYSVRVFGSLAFLLFQIGRMAVVLFLPALALATVSPVDVYTCILLMGVLCMIYTVMGGIEAVIWTDAIQAIVLICGAFITVIVIVVKLGGDIGEMVTLANQSDKFKVVNWGWDLTSTSIFVVLFGNVLSNMAPYTSDQAVVQRYLTTPNKNDAAKAIWTNALLVVPTSILFFGVGTALFVFYKRNPAELSPTLGTDAIYPLFIVSHMPIGIAGLVIAGLFAAAQSTLSSSLNSMATVFVEDIYKKARPNSDDHEYLLVARIMTIAFGIIGVSTALVMATMDIKSLWDQFFKILGLFGGGLAGLFALGIFTKRAHGIGAFIGAALSAVVLVVVQKWTSLHFFMYGGVGFLGCIVLGYLFSILMPADQRDLTNMTIHTQNNVETNENNEEY